MKSSVVAAVSAAKDHKQATGLDLQNVKIGMISLGCAKNLVDAEIMLGSVLQRGMEITSRAEEADVLVVNTCAFIDSAKEEDRKSTRLNSSHLGISYAVFCLKKKKNKDIAASTSTW